MSTLALVGTAGGAGASTLAALAFAGLRHRPKGAPVVLTDGPHGIAERLGDDEVALVNRDTTIWDVGSTGPRAVVAMLERPGTAVVIATPATPLGLEDASAIVAGAVERFGEGIRNRICVAVSDVYRAGRAAPTTGLPSGVAVVRIPYDPALDTPGPIPPAAALDKRTHAAIESWLRLAGGALPE